jgi:predicted MPP superfamily phosphohydrolase
MSAKYTFFLIFIFVVALPGIYAVYKIWNNLASPAWLRGVILFLYIFSFILLVLYMFAGEVVNQDIAAAFSSAGFTWLVATVYLTILFLSFDLLHGLLKISGFDHYLAKKVDLSVIKHTATLLTLTITALLLVWGNYRFNHPQVREMEIDLSKGEPLRELKVVIASDLHLGAYIGRSHLERFVSMINGENPDLVLLAGDISDMEDKPLKEQNMAGPLSEISSRYGVYAVPGNHEFYGGVKEEIITYLKSAGITFLIDTSVLAVNGELILIGRDDRTNKERIPLNQLVKGLEKDKPRILLDHQPFDIGEAESENIDIQISGHTHNGQIWPGNLIVKKIFELGYGYKKRSSTHYIVTSGLGLWGPKYRIGTVSEIVSLRLKY